MAFAAFVGRTALCLRLLPSCLPRASIPSLLLRPFETVLQGRVCTQTNHACLGHTITQCTPSMGRQCRQCACPWQRLLCKFALGLRGRSWQTLEPIETASAWHGVQPVPPHQKKRGRRHPGASPFYNILHYGVPSHHIRYSQIKSCQVLYQIISNHTPHYMTTYLFDRTLYLYPCVHSAEKLCPLNRLQTQPYTTKWRLNLNQPPLLQNGLGVFMMDQKPMSVTTKWLYGTIL